ncbi:predicted protein [Botrytis cinerea T4]|uniref:Uncharacterized protein n=1 Tax=Botryotinia fuckeliana (strain T4) TaxID=999810 RepID=G2XNS0_BOTF4|nr:predicted protein [Botrytis cinerea T4]
MISCHPIQARVHRNAREEMFMLKFRFPDSIRALPSIAPELNLDAAYFMVRDKDDKED